MGYRCEPRCDHGQLELWILDSSDASVGLAAPSDRGVVGLMQLQAYRSFRFVKIQNRQRRRLPPGSIA
jgi:hypothetical protein